MEILSVPRVAISGVKAGVGKALLGIGITHELRRRGLSVSPVMHGPNLLQGTIHKRISGRYVRCIDPRILNEGEIVLSTYFSGIGADLILCHGQAGLFDGYSPNSFRGSDAELCSLTRTPVVLVVDVDGFGASVAALYKGYSDFVNGCDICGAILNRVELGAGREVKNRDFFEVAFQAASQPAPIGALPTMNLIQALPPRDLSVQTEPSSLSVQFFVELGQLVSQHIDLDELLLRAGNVASVRLEDFDYQPSSRRCRIAVSDDSCFNVLFQDNLDLLRYYGAEIVTFSPLADTELPSKVGGLYLTGAYLPAYIDELSKNSAMKRAIREFSRNGGVIYSEGAGTAYLCKEFKLGKSTEVFPGVGLIDACVAYSPGQVVVSELTAAQDSILGQTGTMIRGILGGTWKVTKEGVPIKTVRVAIPGADTTSEGYSPNVQTFATFCFLHMGSNLGVAQNIVDAAEVAEQLA